MNANARHTSASASSPLRLAIIVPCFNEEAVLPATDARLRAELARMMAEGVAEAGSFILYVDDGSTDATPALLEAFSRRDGIAVEYLSLSRNEGHQSALLAGLEEADGRCDACITIDADLQDDPGVMAVMVRRCMEGDDIVFGVRENRDSDSHFKRATARAYYRLQSRFGLGLVEDHADYRLLSRRALSALMLYPERLLFLRGLVARLGFRCSRVGYRRAARAAGESKYPFGRMMEFAVDGITSFSVRPVRMVFFAGLLFTLCALGVAVYALARHFSGHTIPGWTSLMLSLWFCTGVVLLALGVVGEYVGKIFIEVKRRPRYHVAARSERKSPR